MDAISSNDTPAVLFPRLLYRHGRHLRHMVIFSTSPVPHLPPLILFVTFLRNTALSLLDAGIVVSDRHSLPPKGVDSLEVMVGMGVWGGALSKRRISTDKSHRRLCARPVIEEGPCRELIACAAPFGGHNSNESHSNSRYGPRQRAVARP